MRRNLMSRVLICALFIAMSGCASSFKKVSKWLGVNDDTKTTAQRAPANEPDDTTGVEQEVIKMNSPNDNPNLGANEFAPQQRLFDEKAQRGFRRNVDPWTVTGNYNEASLWNPDAQENYLFTRNMVHKLGDFVIVKLEPDLQESLNGRLTALYRPPGSKPKLKDTIAEEAGKAAGEKVGEAVEKAVGNKAIADAAREDVADRTVAAFTEKARYFTTKEVPVRIVDVSARGTVRVEGVKKLFLKNGSFDLKVSGILREEDIGPSRVVASSRLMEQKVEIVK
jgi:flagellar basal body L-ring protein FlgH